MRVGVGRERGVAVDGGGARRGAGEGPAEARAEGGQGAAVAAARRLLAAARAALAGVLLRQHHARAAARPAVRGGAARWGTNQLSYRITTKYKYINKQAHETSLLKWRSACHVFSRITNK